MTNFFDSSLSTKGIREEESKPNLSEISLWVIPVCVARAFMALHCAIVIPTLIRNSTSNAC
jgi:hypothetical protein